MQSDGSVIVDGKFAPAAVVTVIADKNLSTDGMLEMRAGVSAAFRLDYAPPHAPADPKQTLARHGF